MLQFIEIDNFRCFRHSRFGNFGHVNLIGGKNNAGKTALLEALLLVNEPTSNSVAFLQQLRSENSSVFEERPELAWGNFFLHQNKNSVIKLLGEYDIGDPVLVEIKCVEQPKSATNSNGTEQGSDALVKVEDSSTMAEIGVSTLTISSKSADGESETEIKYDWTALNDRYGSWPKVRSNQKQVQNTFLVPTGFKKPVAALARELEKAKLHEETSPILEAFRIVDDSIMKIDSINLGEPRIYIFRKGEKAQSLNFFGDALNKIADLILRISNNPNCILLIDEIENGIHHSNQKEFWQMVIKLAVVKDVQIFATSHSAEMIGAFQAAAVANKQEDKVRFIEMYKNQRTGEIVGDSVDMETLAFDIQNNNPYRGEELVRPFLPKVS